MWKTLVSISLLTLLSMPAQSNNGTSEVMYSVPWSMYVECLGETVEGTIYVVARGHNFETPSGTSHFIDKWTTTLDFVGVSTGRQWFGRGLSPAGGHSVKNGESFFYTDRAKLDPVSVYGIEDGPSWIWNLTMQVRWDEEGELTKEFINFAGGGFRCLGPN